eukprot:RCo029575
MLQDVLGDLHLVLLAVLEVHSEGRGGGLNGLAEGLGVIPGVELVPHKQVVVLALPLQPTERLVQRERRDGDLELDGSTEEVVGVLGEGVQVLLLLIPWTCVAVFVAGVQGNCQLARDLPKHRQQGGLRAELHHVGQRVEPHVGLPDELALHVHEGVRAGLALGGRRAVGLGLVPLRPQVHHLRQSHSELLPGPHQALRADLHVDHHICLVGVAALEELCGEHHVAAQVGGDHRGLLHLLLRLGQLVPQQGAQHVLPICWARRGFPSADLGLGDEVVGVLGQPLAQALAAGVAEPEGVVVAQPNPILMEQLAAALQLLAVDQSAGVVVYLNENTALGSDADTAVVLLDAQPVELNLRGLVRVRLSNNRIALVEGVHQGLRDALVLVQIDEEGPLLVFLAHRGGPAQGAAPVPRDLLPPRRALLRRLRQHPQLLLHLMLQLGLRLGLLLEHLLQLLDLLVAAHRGAWIDPQACAQVVNLRLHLQPHLLHGLLHLRHGVLRHVLRRLDLHLLDTIR